MRKNFCTAILVALLGVSVTAGAQSRSEGLTLRADSANISDEVVRFIATHARPTRVELADSPQSTPRQLITKLCGSFRHAYFLQFRSENKKLKLGPDDPIRRRGISLTMPACLYARQAPERFSTSKSDQIMVSHLSKPGSTPPRPAEIAITHNFPTWREPPAATQWTEPVYLVPKKLSAQRFLADIPLSNPDGTAPAVFQSIEPIKGEIVLGQIASNAGPTAARSAGHCTELAGAPFDAGKVAANYRYSRQRTEAGSVNARPGAADVVVVDNGFFGARADPRLELGARFAGSPFKVKDFNSNNASTVEKRLILPGGDFESQFSWPINFSNNIEPNVESSHGTHVTGLVLGGPSFVPVRDFLAGAKFSWAQLTIINIARGARQLLPGAHDLLHSNINLQAQPLIVNMSIAHDARGSRDAANAYKRLFREGANHLFIVAAGNHSQDVTAHAIVPAAQGGAQSDHVITVAALDGNGRVAKFSNTSSTAVDMGAPGCGIASWVSNTDETVKLSGTSQAAPLVTFAASLLRSLARESEASMLKFRLIASGDMLDPADQESTAYRVALNIPKALLWFDDYVKLTGANGGEYLGTVRSLKGVRCSGAPSGESRALSDLWSFKREAQSGLGWLFAGKATNQLLPPCRLDGMEPGTLTFAPTHVMGPDGPRKLDAPEMSVPLSNVSELVPASLGSD